MTIQVVVPNFEKSYPRRRDRLHEEPSAKNAQGLFPPDACLFVGNLSTKVGTDELAADLKKLFTDFGPCHVKIKQDKKKGLPGAFVQFEKVEDASAALVNTDRAMLHDRWLRIERAKGRRTAGLGLRSGAPITPEDLSFALEGRGPVEAYWFEHYPVGPQIWALICKVTFAYVDDCRDAIKHFQKDDKYYLSLLDMDGSPMLPSPGRDYPLQMRGNNSSQMARNNNNARYNNAKVYRNLQNRGGYRGLGWRPSSQHLQQQQQSESQSLPYIRDHFPIPPIWMNGMQYNHDAHQPVYPPLGPHLNSFYGTPTMLMHGQPIFDHLPLPSLPEVYLSPSLGGPFIINSPLQYDGGVPAFDHEAFPPHNGFPSVPSGSISQHGGYSWNNQQAYDGQGAYVSKLDDRPPPQEQHKTQPPPTICETVNDKAAGDTGIEKLLELNRPEAPPKLIRVDEFDRCTTPKKKEPLEPVKEEDQDGNDTQATELTGDSASMSDSSSSKISRKGVYTKFLTLSLLFPPF
ncbi:hypothetical protein N7528_007216 [Penicillium herquei]|nr:hypothetical protein N7528_007216 [Penicillium herquei]